MIKKIFFVLFACGVAFAMNWFRIHSGHIVIDFTTIQVVTSTNFVLCCLLFLWCFFYLFRKFREFIFRPDNLQKKVVVYSNYIVRTLVNISTNNVVDANRMLKKAAQIFDNNLTSMLRCQILNLEQKYEEARAIFKTIDLKELNSDLTVIKLDFETAKRCGDENDIEKCAMKLLEIEPTHVEARKSLLNIYISKQKWEFAYQIFQGGMRQKIFNNKRGEFFVISRNLGQKYYNENHFFDAKQVLREAYKSDPHRDIDIVNLLAKTYIILDKKQKAAKIIESTWKQKQNMDLLDTYYLSKGNQINSFNVAKKLVSINSKSFESNYAMARAYYYNKFYGDANRYAKIAENIRQCKLIYELMLRIEEDGSANSVVISTIKNKIARSSQ